MSRAAAALVVLAFAAVAEAAEPAPVAIEHVTVIDATGRPPRRDVTVLLEHGRIAAIGAARVPAGASVVDGSGKFLIPGLWNLHLHAVSYDEAKAAFPALLAAGVTGVRDMGAPLADAIRLRAETASGALVGPRLVVAGPLLQGPLPFDAPLIVQVKTAADAEATVRLLKNRGVDFIKVHDALPHDVYVAIAKAARRLKLPLDGHVPPTVRAAEASDLGQRSIEHLGGQFFGVLVAASSDAERLAGRTNAMYTEDIAALNAHKAPPFENLQAGFTRPLVESYDEVRAAALFARFKKNGTWQCPTLVALSGLWAEHDSELTADDKAFAEKVVARSKAVVGAMHRAGVPILAGTDGPYAGGGARLQDELALLVESGLTPTEAIQAATRDAARFLGIEDRGTIAVGKRADLVLLDADPLADIHNVRAVARVFLGGVSIPRAGAGPAR